MVTMQVKGIPLIKFKSKEIIDSLRSGKIYLNSLKWFRDYENDNGDMVIGDSFEGMIHISEGELLIPSISEHTHLEKRLINTSATNSYVFCMSCIHPQNESFKYSELQKQDFREFGDTALVILDSEEFLKRIEAEATKQGYKIYFNEVRYYNPDVDDIARWSSLKQGMHNVAFWKREEYRHQQEFRMVILDDGQGQDHIELEIGDISEISMVFPIDKILNAEFKRN